MTEQLISYETAKLAWEKGFIIETFFKYYDCPAFEEMQHGSGKYWEDELGYEAVPARLKWLFEYTPQRPIDAKYNAPSQGLLQKWLRDIHGWHIILIPVVTMGYTFKVMRVWKKDFNPEAELKIELPPYKEVHAYDYKDYEEALEAALKEVLTLI